LDRLWLPNYTQIANKFIDEMPKYSGSTIKVFIAISRKTIGWHKISDRISYSQLQQITGLSVNAIKKSIKELIKDRWIVQQSTKYGYKYDLNIAKSDISENDIALSKNDTPLSESDTKSAELISDNDTTKEITKETILKETNIKRKGNGKIVFPPSLDNDLFRTTWAEWEKYRKDIKKKLTSLTRKKQLAKLAKFAYSGTDCSIAIAMINRSIENGWQGLFDLPESEKPKEDIKLFDDIP